MKTLFTILCLSICIIASAQKTKTAIPVDSLKIKIELSASELMTIADHDEFLKKIQELQKEVSIREDEYSKFFKRILTANKVPLARMSYQGDSLQITDKEILIKLRSKPKK